MRTVDFEQRLRDKSVWISLILSSVKKIASKGSRPILLGQLDTCFVVRGGQRKHRRKKARTRKRGKRKGRKVHLLSVSNHEQATKVRGALVDRGANGGVAGADTRVIQASRRYVDITGIDNHKIIARSASG